MQQVSLKSLGTFFDFPIDDIQLVDPTFAVVALLAGQKEIPLAPIGQDGQWYAIKERIFEKLSSTQ